MILTLMHNLKLPNLQLYMVPINTYELLRKLELNIFNLVG